MNRRTEVGLYGRGIGRAISKPARKPTIRPNERSLMTSILVLGIALIVASSLAIVSKGSDDTSRPGVLSPPGTPFFVIGFTYDEVGNILPDCGVNITDLTTGDWDNTTVSDSNGYYRFDMNSLSGGYQVGDVVNATAYSSGVVGWNETVITYSPHLWLNVTVTGILIPEFSDLGLPLAGMISVLAIVLATSRNGRRQN